MQVVHDAEIVSEVVPPESPVPDNPIVMEGMLRKKASNVYVRTSPKWNVRYFTLRGNVLNYYKQKKHIIPRGEYILNSSCSVSDVFLEFSKDKKQGNENHADPPGTGVINTVQTHSSAKVKKSDTKTTIFADQNQLDSNVYDELPPNRVLTGNMSEDSSDNIRYCVKLTWSNDITINEENELYQTNGTEDSLSDNESPHDSGPQRHYAGQIELHSYRQQLQVETKDLVIKRAQRKRRKNMVAKGGQYAAMFGAAVTATAVTSGVGLGFLFVVSAVSAAAGGSVATQRIFKKGKRAIHTLVISGSSEEEMEKWKAALEVAVSGETVENETWVGLFREEGRSTTTCLLPTAAANNATIPAQSGRRNKKIEFYEGCMRWRPLEGGWAMLMGSGTQGLRIFQEEEHNVPKLGSKFFSGQLSVRDKPCPALKAQLIVNATPLNAFMCLMSYSRLDHTPLNQSCHPRSQQRASFRIIETFDDHMDIIHLVFRPIYLFPSWTHPRDFCLRRYWRYDDDGSYVVCYDSCVNPACDPEPAYTRGELHGVFTIAPRKRRSSSSPECMLTYCVQVDPRGWVPTMSIPYLASQSYAEAFAVSALMQMIDVKDALDRDRFVPISLDALPQRSSSHKEESDDDSDTQVPNKSDGVETDRFDDHQNYDFFYANNEAARDTTSLPSPLGIASFPSTLDKSQWAEPDANSFVVRGRTYKQDKVKINAGDSVFRLIAVDLVCVDAPIFTGMCAHPKERVQQALAKGDEGDMPPYIVAINILCPGPPFYHIVIYYAVTDLGDIDGSKNTPFSKLAKEFFFGDSDKFRNNTFKLIPQIVEGNFIVRKAVGSTPAISGTKLAHTYIKGHRFFELIIDVGSSAVAAGGTRISLAYASSLKIDLAFILQGVDESTLPERVMGCVRFKNVDFNKELRFVKEIDDLE